MSFSVIMTLIPEITAHVLVIVHERSHVKIHGPGVHSELERHILEFSHIANADHRYQNSGNIEYKKHKLT